jgi:acetolactate synthase I/II/III large subunit
VDERAPYAGGVIGAFGWPSSNDLLATADTVLAIGTKLGTSDTIDENPVLLDPRRQRLIQVDIDPLMVGWTTPVSRAVVSDAAIFLQQLLKRNDGTAAQRPIKVQERTAEAHAAPAGPEVRSDEVPFTPQRVIDVLNTHLPENAIVTADAGENRLFMMRWFRSRRPGGYLQPGAGGGMGHAVPAALGAKLAYPDAPVIAVCGDGGFAMSMHGLMTAVEAQLPIGVVVFNNRALGWVLHGMGEQVIAAQFGDFDHPAIARALGCDGVRANSVGELEAAVSRLSSLERPFVIDVPISLTTSFRDILDPLDRRRASSGGY